VAMASGENNDKENELRSIKKTFSGRTTALTMKAWF